MMGHYASEFLLPEKTYFSAHSVGCLTRHGYQASIDFLEQWHQHGTDAWETWLAEMSAFRYALANLLHAEASEFCPKSNVSSAVYDILSSLPKRKRRNKILLSDLDFPSIGFIFDTASKHENYKIEFIRHANGFFSLAQWEKYLQDDVQLVFITHVLSGNSFCNDVEAILEIARSKGIITIVDIAQSVGVIPIDLQKWGADFAVGSSVKWLCGGPGAGFLWMNPQGINQFFPKQVGWFSHQDPFEFDIFNFQYATDATRYMTGTPSIQPYMIARRSIELLTKIGIHEIYQHNQTLIDRMIEGLQTKHIFRMSPRQKEQRGGTLVISSQDLSQLIKVLEANNFIFNCLPNFGARLSPHIYNRVEEVDRLIGILQ